MCWENYRNPEWVDPWEFYDWPDYFSWEEWPHYQPYGPWCRMPFPHGPWIQQFGPPVTPDEEIAFLKDRARMLQEELNAIEREISEFEQAA